MDLKLGNETGITRNFWLFVLASTDLQLEITKSSSNTFYPCNVSNAISWGMATIEVEPLCNYTGVVKTLGKGTDSGSEAEVETTRVEDSDEDSSSDRSESTRIKVNSPGSSHCGSTIVC
ncbi:hypothetical protein Y1Q_0022618 [Alligator mississippiensis]|uniref:Uncharacterized protein n=1 Tax=Alligator mississippiensis TaxID=8496 RepID=A0A151N7U3_ALLMI|nr:hypothetical protein Y1Q_0022618 [Alligator mississippiensis]